VLADAAFEEGTLVRGVVLAEEYPVRVHEGTLGASVQVEHTLGGGFVFHVKGI